MSKLYEREAGEVGNHKVTIPWLQQKYAEFVTKYFSKDVMPELNNIRFGYYNSKKSFAHAQCTWAKGRQTARGWYYNHGISCGNYAIEFSTFFNDITEQEAMNTLLHEMIHIWQYCNEPPSTWKANSHGRNFLIKARPMKADGYAVVLVGDNSMQRHRGRI